jgi:hypothetical protein
MLYFRTPRLYPESRAFSGFRNELYEILAENFGEWRVKKLRNLRYCQLHIRCSLFFLHVPTLRGLLLGRTILVLILLCQRCLPVALLFPNFLIIDLTVLWHDGSSFALVMIAPQRFLYSMELWLHPL